MAELSLRWLLFLGVFLVVLSSGVLAASQWQRFNGVGQYTILLAYTLAFFGVGRWSGRQTQLHLTTRTLEIVTCLLVPVNFWAMDSLGLWRSPLGWLTVGLATPLLVAVLRPLLRPLLRSAPNDVDPSALGGRSSLVFFVGLSLLQWGWAIGIWPLVAVYCGLLGPLALVLNRPPRRASPGGSPAGLTLQRSLLIYALAILLLRAIFGVGVALPQLGIAIALAGAMVAASVRRDTWGQPTPNPASAVPFVPTLAELLGGGLIGLGWLWTVETLPGQAAVISVIALGFWGQRLIHVWRRRDWLLWVLIALQLAIQGWRLLPHPLPVPFMRGVVFLAGSADRTWTAWGLGLFPYVGGLVASAFWFERRQQPKLAAFSDLLALGLGSVLITLSWPSPGVRTCTLAAAAVCAWFASRRPGVQGQGSAIYLCHGLGLLSIILGMHWQLPQAPWGLWASLGTGLAVAEWAMAFRLRSPSPQAAAVGNLTLSQWRTSAVAAGLGLALWSYGLWIWQIYGLVSSATGLGSDPRWALGWLAIPLALTLGAVRRRSLRPVVIPWSALALGLWPLLTLPTDSIRIPSLVLALGLMGVNTYLRPRLLLALATWGFGLLALGLALGEGSGLLPAVRGADWFLVMGLALQGLWAIARYGRGIPLNSTLGSIRQHTAGLGFGPLLRRGAWYWGGAIATLLLISLTVHNVDINTWDDLPRMVVVSAYLLAVALALALVQRPHNTALGFLAWALELVLLETLRIQDWISPLVFTLGHLGLAGTTLIGQGLWQRWVAGAGVAGAGIAGAGGDRPAYPDRRFPHLTLWPGLILTFCALAFLSRIGTVSLWTGFSTLTTAALVIQSGRMQTGNLQTGKLQTGKLQTGKLQTEPPQRPWSLMTVLGLALATLGTWELLLYSLRSQPLDGQLPALACLTTLLAVLYRLVLVSQGSFLCLSPVTLRRMGHGHWLLAGGLLLSSFSDDLSNPTLAPLKIGTGVVLCAYALLQGRITAAPQRPAFAPAFWTYLGFFSGLLLRFYIWDLVPPSRQAQILPWLLAIVASGCAPLWFLPWRRWGWTLQPWRQLSLGLPLVVAWTTWANLAVPSLWIAAVSYGVLGWRTGQLRLTYVSLIFLDLGVWRWAVAADRSALLWYTLPLGLSLLWIAQLDPHLAEPDQREPRHSLRMAGLALICGVALLPDHGPWLVPALSLGAVLLGLALQVRAFLFVGTLSFLWTVFDQLVVLVSAQSLLKWAVGLVAGMVLIWVAATFETRREQIRTVLQTWATELEQWQ